MKKCKLQPEGFRVVIKREDMEEKVGGIILPDVAKKKQLRGTIVAVGSGLILDSGELRPPNFEVGDRVLFPAYEGTEVTVGGEDLLVFPAGEILGKLVDDE